MKLLTSNLIVAIMLIAHTAYGHGENKPGPNGGFIKMPGAFHTEVVPVGQNKLKVFLLDMNWKNPSILNSNLSVTHKASGTTTATCQPRKNYYVCEFAKHIDVTKSGQLLIEAQRENQKGNVAIYNLPLKLQSLDNGHEGH